MMTLISCYDVNNISKKIIAKSKYIYCRVSATGCRTDHNINTANKSNKIQTNNTVSLNHE
jgi:hypothetical protein